MPRRVNGSVIKRAPARLLMKLTNQREAGRPDATFVNLADAHLCSDCEAIGNSAVRCPRCQSQALIAITRAIRRHRDSIRLVCVPFDEQAA